MDNKPKEEARAFYKDAMQTITDAKIPFLVGGAYALKAYTGIYRDTKDLDLFCKASDYPKIVKLLANKGWRIEVTDARWIAKAIYNEYFIDIIFSTASGICVVDDSWFTHAPKETLFNLNILLIPPEELIWCKAYLMDRERFDGSDINHLFLKKGKDLDWKRLLMRMEQHWEILLAHILIFRFVYPSEIKAIPKKVLEELLSRTKHQFDIPIAVDKVCRGEILSRTNYDIDTKEWGYKSIT